MLAKLLLVLEGPMDRFERKHPFLAFLVMHFATACILITAVAGVALAGGMVIWMFYKLTGVM